MEQGEHLVDWLYQIRCDLKQSVLINVSLRASQSTLHGISVDMPDGQGDSCHHSTTIADNHKDSSYLPIVSRI